MCVVCVYAYEYRHRFSRWTVRCLFDKYMFLAHSNHFTAVVQILLQAHPSFIHTSYFEVHTSACLHFAALPSFYFRLIIQPEILWWRIVPLHRIRSSVRVGLDLYIFVTFVFVVLLVWVMGSPPSHVDTRKEERRAERLGSGRQSPLLLLLRPVTDLHRLFVPLSRQKKNVSSSKNIRTVLVRYDTRF